MNLSIRSKLFIALSSLVLLFVLISLVGTQLGLEKFYIWQKKNILMTSSQAVDALYQGTPETIALDLERISNTLGAGLIIVSPEGQMKYSSFGPLINQKISTQFSFSPGWSESPDHSDPNHPTPQFPPGPPHILKSREVVDNQTILDMQQDSDLKIDFIVLEHQLKNQDTLVIRQPLAPISESVTVAVQFMIFTGLLVLLAGCFWAFILAKKFTQPIVELNRIAQSMSQLDFSQKCTIDHTDEFGELGRSINHLSNQLDTSMSELNHRNRQLMADVEKERKLDKMRKEFVSNVSHELKTPLSLILGYAEGLKENVMDDEATKNEYCSIIMDEAEKMSKLVKDLLNLSQIESGMFKLNRSDFSLVVLLDDLAFKYHASLAEKGITLQIDKVVSSLVNGDELRIEQVLLNIFTNAINHTEKEKLIQIYASDCNTHIRVFIVNSGRAIPEECLEKLWTSFYKVDQAHTREYGGYGLGLSIVRAIQELHGNCYGVENVPNGVMFWFDIDKAGLGQLQPQSLNAAKVQAPS
jgi:signal transduction histidine kinase